MFQYWIPVMPFVYRFYNSAHVPWTLSRILFGRVIRGKIKCRNPRISFFYVENKLMCVHMLYKCPYLIHVLNWPISFRYFIGRGQIVASVKQPRRYRKHSRYGRNQRETTLQCSVISQWPIPYPEWSMRNGKNGPIPQSYLPATKNNKARKICIII